MAAMRGGPVILEQREVPAQVMEAPALLIYSQIIFTLVMAAVAVAVQVVQTPGTREVLMVTVVATVVISGAAPEVMVAQGNKDAHLQDAFVHQSIFVKMLTQIRAVLRTMLVPVAVVEVVVNLFTQVSPAVLVAQAEVVVRRVTPVVQEIRVVRPTPQVLIA